MKKFLLLLTLFLSLAGIAKATETATFLFSDKWSTDNTAMNDPFIVDGFKLEFQQGSYSTNAKYYAAGSRIYSGNKIVLTVPAGFTATQIDFTGTSSKPIQGSFKASDNSTLTFTKPNATWKGSLTNGSITFTNNNSGQVQCTKIVVTYSKASLGDIAVTYPEGIVGTDAVTVPSGTKFTIKADNATSITVTDNNGYNQTTSAATAEYVATQSATINVSATDGTATKEFSFTTDVYTAPDAPIFTVDGVSTGVKNGYFYGATLSMTGAGSIYYTTDGSTPSATEGTPYSEAIALPEGSTTYKAIVNDGSHDSAVTSAAYTVKKLTAAWSATDGAEVYPGTEITATANADAAKIFINGAEATSYTIPETAAIGSEITLSAYATVEADNATVTSETATITVKVVEQPTEVVIDTKFFGTMASSSYKAYTAEDDFATYATVMNYQNSKLYWNTNSNNGCGLIINCKGGYYIESIDFNSPSATINVFTSDVAYTSTTQLASANRVGQITKTVTSYSFTGTTPLYVGLRPNGTSNMNFVSITIHYKKFGSDKPAIKLAWSESNFTTDIVSKNVEDAPVLSVTPPAEMTESDALALVKYSSSKPSVATIDDNGNLEILGLGATEIKAYIDDTNYQYEETSYKLVVIDPNAVTATDRLDLTSFGFTENTYANKTYLSPSTGILYSACGTKSTNENYSGGISINGGMAGSHNARTGIAVTTNDNWVAKKITVKWFGWISPSSHLHLLTNNENGYTLVDGTDNFGFVETWLNEDPANNGTSVFCTGNLNTPAIVDLETNPVKFLGLFSSNLHSIEYIEIVWEKSATPEVKILSEDATSITVGVEHADYILHYKKIHNNDWNNHWGSEAANAPARVAQDTTGEPLADSEDWVSTGTNTITIDKTIADHQNRHYKFTAFHKDDTALANELNHVNFLIDGDGTLTGIEGIGAEAGADAPAEYYDLQGRRVANPVSGLYIRRTGPKVEKVFVK